MGLRLRVLITSSTDPYYNVSLEQAIARSVAEDEIIMYLWQNYKTVVVGRNQDAWSECRAQELEDSGGHVMRRRSGGGAVFHDMGNLNFTFVSPPKHYDLTRNMRVIQRALERFGLKAELSGRNDITVDGAKFSGNAFFNTPVARVHHGTIMLDVDLDMVTYFLTPDASKLASKGVKSVRSRVVNLKALAPDMTIENLTDALKAAFDEVFEGKAAPYDMSQLNQETFKADYELFSSAAWRLGAQKPHNVSIKNRFDWGNVEVRAEIADGNLTQVQLFSDALDADAIMHMGAVLNGASLSQSTDELHNTLLGNLSSTASDLARQMAKDLADLIIGYAAQQNGSKHAQSTSFQGAFASEGDRASFDGSENNKAETEAGLGEKSCEYIECPTDIVDVIVIGAGPGGIAAALEFAGAGKSVALIEKDKVGGTCLNRGCIPTKALLHASGTYYKATHSDYMGVTVEGAKVDFSALRSYTTGVVDTLRRGMEQQLERAGARIIKAQASLEKHTTSADLRVVTLTANEGTISQIAAPEVFVATGRKPWTPNIVGKDLPGVYTSDELLEQLPEVKDIVIVGSGVIGLECACVYAQLGARVVVLEALSDILRNVEKDAVKLIASSLKSLGVSINTEVMVQSIEQKENGSGLVVTSTVKGKTRTDEAQAVLLACGRVPEREVFGMPGALDEHAMHFHVTAVGDVKDSSMQLAHLSTAEGIVEACQKLGLVPYKSSNTIPVCVYTTPEVAQVGETEESMRERGLVFASFKLPFGANGKATLSHMGRGYVKLVADSATGRLVGATLVCDHASDIINTLVYAIENNMQVSSLAHTVFSHPSLAEAVGDTAIGLIKKFPQLLPKT